MDNLSHSLVGLALGELADRALPAEPDPQRARTRRRVLLATGLLSSNFPDLDLFLTPLLAEPLGYLMHHRGHTHTLLYALPQVALLLALLWLLWPGARRLLAGSAAARRGVLAASVAGMLLHLAMDALNVYGLHPFHPLDARWLYGDMVFIIEPVFWCSFGVALAMLAPGGRPRRVLLVLLAAAPVLFTLQGFLQWGSLLGLGLLGGAVALAARLRGAAAGLLAALAASLGFVGVQAVAGNEARAQVRAAQLRLDPGSRILDLPLSAFPSNPLCWAFATVSDDGRKGSYAVRLGVLSLAPGLNPVAHCPARFGGGAAGPAALAWNAHTGGSLAQLRALQRDNCHFDAWLRFARVPYLAGGIATDVRYSRPGEANFSSLPYAERAGQPCPAPLPRWGRPRADLLGLEPD
ncbi:metal-dependent hydrolase [Massilia niastensis]|uniref:metal-dependent hydrolase n=1 Tax=Massilia niastensis TaxID=544911 RepID=UPI00036E5288|nr:metal-dependent hydrolase [Massilia niastensis]